MKPLNPILACCFLFLLFLLPSNGFPIFAIKKSKRVDKPHKIYTSSMFEHWTSKQSGTKSSSWNYHDTDAWANLPESLCGGKQQSPVDIEPRQAVRKAYPKFTFTNYGNIDKMDLMNSGHTAMYSLPKDFPEDKVPFITGGGLNDTFKFVQFHLHWGSDSTKGSEHLVRSKSYPAELHMVHYNTKYGTYADATTHPDGLAVLGIFLKIGSSDSESFRPLIDQLGEVINANAETTLKNLISFKDLLPRQTTSFYRYSGSLTTPKCNEIVIWTVFDNPIQVSEQQLDQFRKLEDAEAEQLVDNFRPSQKLNNRIEFYRSFTGCEIPQSWPFTFSPLRDLIIWARCIIAFAFSPQ